MARGVQKRTGGRFFCAVGSRRIGGIWSRWTVACERSSQDFFCAVLAPSFRVSNPTKHQGALTCSAMIDAFAR